MNPVLQNKLTNLPAKPGVYQFLNDKGKIIYVGKANNLRNRVKSYFHSKNQNAKTDVDERQPQKRQAIAVAGKLRIQVEGKSNGKKRD